MTTICQKLRFCYFNIQFLKLFEVYFWNFDQEDETLAKSNLYVPFKIIFYFTNLDWCFVVGFSFNIYIKFLSRLDLLKSKLLILLSTPWSNVDVIKYHILTGSMFLKFLWYEFNKRTFKKELSRFEVIHGEIEIKESKISSMDLKTFYENPQLKQEFKQ